MTKPQPPRACAYPPCEKTVTRPNQKYCGPAHKRKAWGITREGKSVLTQAERLQRIARIMVALDALTVELRALQAAEVFYEALETWPTPSLPDLTRPPREAQDHDS